MNVTKEIQRINAGEIERSTSTSASWHAQYKDSPYIFIGNIPFDLTEGDIITVFSQYGEILDLQLVRNKETGESKGFAFLRYEDQRSTILAVDNLNNYTLLGRTLRVDHASAETKDGEKRTGMNAAPPMLKGNDDDESKSSGSDTEDSEDLEGEVDPDDPMREYFIKKAKKEKKKAKKKAKKEKKRKKRNEDEEIGTAKDVTRKLSQSRSRLSVERELNQDKHVEGYTINKSHPRSRSRSRGGREHEYDHDRRRLRSRDRYYPERNRRQKYSRSPSPSYDHYDRYDNNRNYRRNKRGRSRSVDKDRKKKEVRSNLDDRYRD